MFQTTSLRLMGNESSCLDVWKSKSSKHPTTFILMRYLGTFWRSSISPLPNLTLCSTHKTKDPTWWHSRHTFGGNFSLPYKASHDWKGVISPGKSNIIQLQFVYIYHCIFIQGIVGCTPTNVPLWEIPIEALYSGYIWVIVPKNPKRTQ